MGIKEIAKTKQQREQEIKQQLVRAEELEAQAKILLDASKHLRKEAHGDIPSKVIKKLQEAMLLAKQLTAVAGVEQWQVDDVEFVIVEQIDYVAELYDL